MTVKETKQRRIRPLERGGHYEGGGAEYCNRGSVPRGEEKKPKLGDHGPKGKKSGVENIWIHMLLRGRTPSR